MKVKTEVLRNKRIEPNNFTVKYDCSFCDKFQSQLLSFEKNSEKIIICKACLTRMIEKLDEYMKDKFQEDFENREKGEK